MPFKSITPILPATDIIRASEFYKDILGFEVNIFTAHDYVVMKKGDIGLHLWKTDDKNLCENSGCYIYVTDIEPIYKDMESAGVVHPNGKLEDKPWGIREFSILDTEGNLLRIGEINNK